MSDEQRARSGVVSLLDDRSRARVEELWDELEARLGVRSVRRAPWPHFSYQVGDYDEAGVHQVLERVANAACSFRVVISGLGIFTGVRPILYLPVVRVPEVSEMHRRVWDAMEDVCTAPVDYYRPARWVPHVTLAEDDLDDATLGAAVRMLSTRSLPSAASVDNLTFIDASGSQPKLNGRFKFGSREPLG